jgi:hypothetical protein
MTRKPTTTTPAQKRRRKLFRYFYNAQTDYALFCAIADADPSLEISDAPGVPGIYSIVSYLGECIDDYTGIEDRFAFRAWTVEQAISHARRMRRVRERRTAQQFNGEILI